MSWPYKNSKRVTKCIHYRLKYNAGLSSATNHDDHHQYQVLAHLPRYLLYCSISSLTFVVLDPRNQIINTIDIDKYLRHFYNCSPYKKLANICLSHNNLAFFLSL